MPDIMRDLFKAAGLNIPIRNFLVDYNNDKEESFFNPLQVICAKEYTDAEIINNVMQDPEMKGMTVTGITEILGEHSLDELKAMAKDVSLLFAAGFRYLYLRNKKGH